MIQHPTAIATLMTAKELAAHLALPISAVYDARRCGFPMPGRQATPREFTDWRTAHATPSPPANSARETPLYDALLIAKELIHAARVSRGFFFSARRCGFAMETQADGTARGTVRALRAWMIAHPDFRAEHGYGRATAKRKGRKPEACADLARVPSALRLQPHPAPLRPKHATPPAQ